jgi:hypothetical protein
MKFPKSQKIESNYNDPSRQTRPSSNTKGAVIYDTFYLILMINNEHEEKSLVESGNQAGKHYTYCGGGTTDNNGTL